MLLDGMGRNCLISTVKLILLIFTVGSIILLLVLTGFLTLVTKPVLLGVLQLLVQLPCFGFSGFALAPFGRELASYLGHLLPEIGQTLSDTVMDGLEFLHSQLHGTKLQVLLFLLLYQVTDITVFLITGHICTVIYGRA